MGIIGGGNHSVRFVHHDVKILLVANRLTVHGNVVCGGVQLIIRGANDNAVHRDTACPDQSADLAARADALRRQNFIQPFHGNHPEMSVFLK